MRTTECSFCSVTSDHRGLLAAFLTESYRPLFEAHRGWEDLPASFRQFDADVFGHLDTLGRCIFFTCLDGEFAGFSSFDPRGAPDMAVIGHNCVAPRFQNRGVGKAQIRETLARLKQRSIRKATATTSEHPFFLPALRMYVSCGFSETHRSPAPVGGRHGTIALEQELMRRAAPQMQNEE